MFVKQTARRLVNLKWLQWHIEPALHACWSIFAHEPNTYSLTGLIMSAAGSFLFNDSDEDIDRANANVDSNTRTFTFDASQKGVQRYEVSNLMWHLTQLESRCPWTVRQGPAWDALHELIKKFFDANSETWRGWLRTLWISSDEVDKNTGLPIDMYEHEEIHPVHVLASKCLPSAINTWRILLGYLLMGIASTLIIRLHCPRVNLTSALL